MADVELHCTDMGMTGLEECVIGKRICDGLAWASSVAFPFFLSEMPLDFFSCPAATQQPQWD